MPRKHSSDRKPIASSDLALWAAAGIAVIGTASTLGWQGAEFVAFIAFLALSVPGIIDLLTWTREPGHIPIPLLAWLGVSALLAAWLAITDQLLELLVLFCLAPWLAIAVLVGARVFRDYVLWQAGRGDADAQYRLAEFYYSGTGMDKDLKTALHWYHLAGQQRHKKAARRLSRLYRRGEGVPKDRRLSDEWRAVSREHD